VHRHRIVHGGKAGELHNQVIRIPLKLYGPVQMIAGSDHSSICKPRDLDDEVYSHLVAFVIKRKLLPSDDPLTTLNEHETARSIEALDGMIQWLRTSPTAGREEAFRAIHQAALAVVRAFRRFPIHSEPSCILRLQVLKSSPFEPKPTLPL
jgi:hypothetical protein